MTTRQIDRSKEVKDPFSNRFRVFYHSKDATDPAMRGKTTPTGVHNFDAFAEFGSMTRIARAVADKKSDKFRALIDGFSTPMNVVAMRDFLVRTMGLHQSAIEIHAIDLSDEAFEEGLKLARDRDIRFMPHVADARTLPFEAGTFSLVFQDFLLNCAPNIMHGEIMDETERVLDPREGFALIGVTTVEGHLKRLHRIELGELGLEVFPAEAFKLVDLHDQKARAMNAILELSGQFLVHTGLGTFVLVTANQDFEFFALRTRMIQAMEAGSLTIMEARLDVGTDRFGNVCHRNRFVLTKNPELLAVENPGALPLILGDQHV
jgi:hypothetical protein